MTDTPTGFRSIAHEIKGLALPEEVGDLIQVSYGYQSDWQLVAELSFLTEKTLWFIFENVTSYRVQDEGVMLGYWESRNSEKIAPSIAYSIEKSAYLSEFSQNWRGEIAERDGTPLRHLCVGGWNACLEVITSTLPFVVYERPAYPR